MTANDKKKYARTARDLGYGTLAVDAIYLCDNEWEADRVLINARKCRTNRIQEFIDKKKKLNKGESNHG